MSVFVLQESTTQRGKRKKEEEEVEEKVQKEVPADEEEEETDEDEARGGVEGAENEDRPGATLTEKEDLREDVDVDHDEKVHSIALLFFFPQPLF